MRFKFFKNQHKTHEGAEAVALTPFQRLERSVMACMLWEDSFYEDGISIAERIQSLVPRCPSGEVTELAVRARSQGNLRHAPLLLMRELARHPERPKIAGALADTIQRADELSEFLELYWSDGREPLSGQVKRGLAEAMRKFDAYQLAKYNRKGRVRLRDVLFMVHAKPKDEAQALIWRQLADDTLPPPDTWEVALSAGADKKETFTRLLRERRLGYLALLRNLRGMTEAGVDESLITDAITQGAAASRALPFRFIAAARAVPALEPVLEKAMLTVTEGMARLPGKTAVVVDVSGSMDWALSKRADLTRMDAAAALAVLVTAIAEDSVVFTFSNEVVKLPPRRGMALVDAVRHSQPHGGTMLGSALREVFGRGSYDRVIVITDEQSAEEIPNPPCTGYMINVASYKNGVGYGAWMHIDGFSESIVRYVQSLEQAGRDN